MEESIEANEFEDVQPAAEVRGRIFDIQRFSLHDGPAIRTTVFLKGCPLRCLWCHNPEGMEAYPQVSFLPEKCIACGECVRTCPNGAHRLEALPPGGSNVTHIYDRNACDVCGKCIETCDAGALESVGRLMTVGEVMREVLQDRAFYATSGGGLTVSGGEPLAQLAFTIALLRAAREQGIHCCLETSGFASWEGLRLLLPWVDLFLFDCKETDPQKHEDFTGRSNAVILENLRALDAAGARIQLQCPIIPGFNDRQDHFAAIAALAQSLPNLEGVRLLSYHPLGESKLHRLGRGPIPNLPHQPLDPDRRSHWSQWLRNHGVRVLDASNSRASAQSLSR